MPETYISVKLEDVLVGETLPATLYLYLDFRFITFRAKGDTMDRSTYERMELKGVRNFFVEAPEHEAFLSWSKERAEVLRPAVPMPEDKKAFAKAREDLHRKTMDIFHSQHPDKAVAQTMSASKKLVSEIMKTPFVVKTLSQLQNYSQGTVDHSVNVSVLSVYLGLQMGYSHALILQHLGTGGLLHDIGKTKVVFRGADINDKQLEQKMRDHPTLGAKLLESMKVPNEVKMIVAQHHECNDGTGYPKKLRGAQIYDLAKIVSIANAFDELVGDGQGALVERQRSAIQQLDQILYKKFDPQKLEKALKILKLGV